MYDLYEARNSIYCYENTDILKNKLNIKDKEKLYDYERKIVLAKLFILNKTIHNSYINCGLFFWILSKNVKYFINCIFINNKFSVFFELIFKIF